MRAHHPDAHPDAPDIAHARFRAVQAAYDVLSGRSSLSTSSPSSHSSYSSPFTRGHVHTTSPWGDDEYIHELARRKRAWDAAQGRRARASGVGGDTRGESERGYAEGFGPRRSAAHADADAGWREDGPRERAVLAFGVAVRAPLSARLHSPVMLNSQCWLINDSSSSRGCSPPSPARYSPRYSLYHPSRYHQGPTLQGRRRRSRAQTPQRAHRASSPTSTGGTAPPPPRSRMRGSSARNLDLRGARG